MRTNSENRQNQNVMRKVARSHSDNGPDMLVEKITIASLFRTKIQTTKNWK